MESIDATPTRPANYALISGVYAAAFGTVAWTSRHRDDRIEGAELVRIGLATFTLTRVLTEQKVESWLRRPFVVEPADGPRRPRGEGMRFAIGELLSCTRCTGSWVGLGLVGLRLRSPRVGRLAATIGAVSAVNDTALAGFAWLAGKANAAATPPPDDADPDTPAPSDRPAA
jgi:hypothetical protein